MWPGRVQCEWYWDLDWDCRLCESGPASPSPSLGNLFAQRLASEFICIILLAGVARSYDCDYVAKMVATI